MTEGAALTSTSENGYAPIADYALIGNCRAAALISRAGSLDWLCLPRFDSPSLFAALLDRHRGGRFRIQPVGPFQSTRRYVPNTNVLETTFTTATGKVRLVDLMTVSAEAEQRRRLAPQHQVLRGIEGLEGEVEMDVLCDPRPDYGNVIPHFEDRGPQGFCYARGGRLVIVRSEIPLASSGSAPGLRGRVRLAAGEKRYVSLVFAEGEPAVLPALGAVAHARLEETTAWWRSWADACTYNGPHRDAVLRSLLTLKQMTYAPSGAVVAAPTTSLPEAIGGVRNWDYRYCWLRDASLTVQALLDLGFAGEADAFVSWMLYTTRLTRPELQIVYNVFGKSRLAERELDQLEGYARSRPVRVGNAAEQQLQMDVYGEVTDAVYEYVCRHGTIDWATGAMIVGFGETVCDRWREPDEGIWEIRGGRRHHTYSKAMCWVALDRLLRLHESGHLHAPVKRFRRERDAIREEIERRGFNERLQSYVSVFDGDGVDASLLRLSRYGYADPHSSRMRGTTALIAARLGKNGLLYRYRGSDDGLPAGEGAFGICSFWYVDALCRQGDLDEAERTLQHLLTYANDVGLYAEEVDPATGDALGNFPQAFTHVGLIDATLTLAACRGQAVGTATRRSGEASAVS